MRTMISAAAAAALLFSAAAPASAQTWYKPAPASGVATGSLTFHTTAGPVSCAVSTPWNLTGGYVRLGNITVSGGGFCSTITIYQTFNVMIALSPPTASRNAVLLINWEMAPYTGMCTQNQSGLFDNATSTITVYGGINCTIGGTLTFPGLQLLP